MVNFKNLTSPYLIGEIGINHNGDMSIAKKLIDAVSACEWNCAKFQKRNPDICVPEAQKKLMRSTPWGMMTYLDYKKKIEFEKNEYDEIDSFCKLKPIDWTASVWDLDSLEFLMNYDVPFIKIPSAMLTNNDLLLECATSGKPLIISTGMSTEKEVDEAVELVVKRTDNVVIMHTNSSYPTPIDELNLNLIPYLQKRYGLITGYSGHEFDLEPTVIAVTLGAKVIERHITLSHDLWGTDQKASLEVHAMSMLQKRVKDVEKILGTDKKEITKSEISVREKLKGN